MINEPLMHKHYMEMSLGELKERMVKMEAERKNYGKGQMPHGMSVYRRRLMKALQLREADHASQEERRAQSQNHVHQRLSPQQSYDAGYQRGRRDALKGWSSEEWEIKDEKERQGYRDGYRSAQARQDTGWSVYRW